MENVPVKLAAQPVPEFNYFVDNQVLTAGQLNTLTDYLDRQDRLTRVRMFGAGIVSGLEVSVSTARASIKVGHGVAITTDGDLLVVPEESTFTHYRDFTDSKAQYAPWKKTGPMLEMLPTLKPAGKSVGTLTGSDLDGNPLPLANLPKFGQMTAVLYLDSYLRPPEDCTDTDCDNLGPKQMNQLRVLLLTDSDVAAAIPNGGQPLPLFQEVPMQRVRMGAPAIVGTNDLGNRFETAIDAAAPAFQTSLKFILEKYSAWMKTAGFGSDWIALFKAITDTRDLDKGVQFAYAALKDLSAALRELRAALCVVQSDDFLDSKAFPKHIALGELSNVESGTAPVLRQRFIEAPKFNRGDTEIDRVRFLLRRIDLMLRGFTVANAKDGTRITPSRLDGLLGERAIPAYFRSDTTVPLHEHWNFDKTRQRNAESIRSYNAAHYSSSPDALEPLKYVHDDCNFYRVEGLLGREKDSVLTELVALRNTNNLPFRVESIQIENDLKKLVLPPRFRPPVFESIWHLQREELFDKLQLAKDYTLKMENTAVKQGAAVESKIDAAKKMAPKISDKVETASKALYVDSQTFTSNYESFKVPYTDALQSSYNINQETQQYAQTSVESPLHQFTVFNHSLQLDRLIDLNLQKTDLIKRQLIFDNFQNQHPGLEFLGGVPAGGTLVIVHQADKVVAEFSLPYAVEFDLDPDIEIKPPVGVKGRPPISVLTSIDQATNDPRPYIWIDRFDDFKDVGIAQVVLPDISALQLQTKEIAVIKTKVDSTDIFVKDWLPNVNKTTVTSNPVLTGGGIANATLGANVNRASRIQATIGDYEAKATRTAEEETALNSLRKEYDKEAAATIDFIAANKLEVAVGTDAFLAITALKTQMSSMSEGSRNSLSELKAVQAKENVVTNSNLNIMVGNLNIRNK